VCACVRACVYIISDLHPKVLVAPGQDTKELSFRVLGQLLYDLSESNQSAWVHTLIRHSWCKCDATRSHQDDLRLAVHRERLLGYPGLARRTWAYNFSNVERSSDVRVIHEWMLFAACPLASDLDDPAAILKLLLFQIHQRSARSDRIDWRLRCCTLAHRSNVTLMPCRRPNIGDSCESFDVASI